MKKIILIFLLSVAIMAPTIAQDTVRYGDSCYLFKEVNSDFIAGFNHTTMEIMPYGSTAFNGPSLKACVPNNEITVYGVAATMLLHPADDTVTSWYTAYLYRDRDTYFELVDSSTAYSDKNLYQYYATHNGQFYEEYVPSLEFYFSKPHVMNESFAIGLKRKIHATSSPGDTIGVYEYVHAYVTRDDGEPLFYPDHSPQLYYGWWGGIFPIIQPERIGCGAAVAEVNERGEDYAVLAWDMDGDSCQLSVVPYNQPVDSAAVVDLTDSSYTATGLSTGIYYAARLRTQCHHRCHIHADTVVWSDWGAPTLFYVGEHEPDTGGVGIRQMEYSPEVSVMPNPAHGSVTVQCEEGIRSVELLTVKGERILCQNMAGKKTCTLDLGGLAKGLYIVQITTAQGTAARKLAVE